MTLPKKRFISATMRLCFKLKYSQWEEQNPTLYSPKQKNKSFVINCDIQAAIMALDNTKLKSKTIPLKQCWHSTHWEKTTRFLLDEYQHTAVGIHKADSLTKRGANNTDATLLKLPIPKVTWDVAIRKRTKHNIWTKWRDAPTSLFTRVWRKKISKSIHNLNRANLRKATMFLTGHVTLN